MIQGLRLPFFSEEDPEVAAEGGIDPLGLAPIADRLAEEIAPGITARMSRIRYLTAMCVAARVLERYEDRVTPDGTPPFLVFEWIVVEAFARKGADLPGEGRQIPGIDKARTALLRKEPLSARNYLKTANVFGFHGVYRTLGESLRLFDRDRALLEAGEKLARTWEIEQGVQGFLDADGGTEGGKLRRRLDDALDGALKAGHTVTPLSSPLHAELLRTFRPDGADRQERALLSTYLLNDREPLRLEVLQALKGHSRDATDSDYTDILARKASPRLKTRLLAIQRYEDLSQRLLCAFDQFAYRASERSTRGISAAEMAHDAAFGEFLEGVPASARSCRAAFEQLDSVSILDLYMTRFSRFEESAKPSEFFERLVEHHEQTQKAKSPRGKRPWFEPAGQCFVIRLPYQRFEPPELTEQFVHPFRFDAMLRFLEEVS